MGLQKGLDYMILALAWHWLKSVLKIWSSLLDTSILLFSSLGYGWWCLYVRVKSINVSENYRREGVAFRHLYIAVSKSVIPK